VRKRATSGAIYAARRAEQRSELGEDGFWLVLEALLGDAEDAVAGDL